MAEPKLLLETALYSYLAAQLSSYTVYNTVAAGSSFNYIVFQAAGGTDYDYHHKKRGRVYAYQVVGIQTDRSTALAMNVAIDAAMSAAKGSLSVSGQGVVRVTRTDVIDYTEVTPDGTSIHHVGGVYEIELEDTP